MSSATPLNRRRTVLLIMVDGLRADYVERQTMPYLRSLSEALFDCEIVPPFGFEADAALFAGLTPEASDTGTHFWRDPGGSCFSITPQWLRRVGDRLPAPLQMALRKYLMMRVARASGFRRLTLHPSTARIPFSQVAEFDVVQKVFPYEAAFPGDSIFEVADRNGWNTVFAGFPETPVDSSSIVRYARAVRSVEGPRLLYFHLGDLDAAGHRLGPEPGPIDAELRHVDYAIQEIVEMYEAMGECEVAIFGDHGMVSVTEWVNVGRQLDVLTKRHRGELLMFLDSTLVRLWVSDKRVANEATGVLAQVPQLRRVYPDYAHERGIAYRHRRFGDFIYEAREGALVHPSYFSRGRPPAGMHGYGPEVVGDHSRLIASRPVPGRQGRCQGRVPMSAVYDVAREMVEAPR